MKERFLRFMAGRNGNDQLNTFLLIISFILILLSGIIRGTVGRLCSIILAAVLVLAYYRMLSRNLVKRQNENRRFMELLYRVKAAIRVMGERWIQRKDYKFFYCPSCRTALRVPRGRGKIMIVCKKCGTKFSGKS